MDQNDEQQRVILQRIAHRVMIERGLLPDFSVEALAELDKIQSPATIIDGPYRDTRELLWCSIDNDDSLDLDQLTVAEPMAENKIRILVAIADVDALVKKDSAIDGHARSNTTSVYTAAEIFPMLPDKLSTNLTSLNFNEDRLAIVIEIIVDSDGSSQDSDINRAIVNNHAKLTYNGVGAWLEGNGPVPEGIAAVKGLEENLRLQDDAAQRMKKFRYLHGALSLETIESKPIFEGDVISNLEVEKKNHATDIIEDFMIAANGATARLLSAKNYPSIRRVVRVPKNWDQIVEIAQQKGYPLPNVPDSKALNEFLIKEKEEDPLTFPDLSLTIIKLLGRGEYVAESPTDISPGHFGLAVSDYNHSTAPNRRFSDLITQRLLKAVFNAMASPYNMSELSTLAVHCTEEEDAANKVERQVAKSAAALLLESRIGEQFDGIVTGASIKGTWVRLLEIPVEGMLTQGFEGLSVGDHIRVQLTSVDVDQGFIDFKKAGI
jgi:ribonuclease R